MNNNSTQAPTTVGTVSSTTPESGRTEMTSPVITTTGKEIACSGLSAPLAGVVGGVIGATVMLLLVLAIAGLVVLVVVLTNRNRAKKRAKNRPILRTPSTHYVRPYSVITRDPPPTEADNTPGQAVACIPKSKRYPPPLSMSPSTVNTYDELIDSQDTDPHTEMTSLEDEGVAQDTVGEMRPQAAAKVKYAACVPPSKRLPPHQKSTPITSTPSEVGVDPYVAMSAVPGPTVTNPAERMYSVPQSQGRQLSSSSHSTGYKPHGGTFIAENVAYKNIQSRASRSLNPIPECGYENIVSKH